MSRPAEVLDFWFVQTRPAQWWKVDPAFDARVREGFAPLHESARRCELFAWRATPEGRLAEVIVLDQFAHGLDASMHVRVVGHTDSTGNPKVNEALSRDRAHAVAEYLVANNTLPRERITEAGFGFNRPLTSDRTAEGRAMNRRVEIRLIQS